MTGLNKQILYTSLGIASILGTSACSMKKTKKLDKPNVIIFYTDDQGYADVGCYGAKGFETPNIDDVAKNGVKFTNFYVPAAVSTPSRAGLLTGRYPERSNLHKGVVSPYSKNGLSPNEYTMAEMFQENGYATSCVGKWHLGHEPQFMPNNHGFDYFYGVPYSNDMHNYYYKHVDFQSPPLPFYRNRELIEEGPDQQYLTKRYTDETVKIIQNKKDKPLFIYLAHNMPHYPIYASPKFQGKSKLGLWGDVIMEIDWSVGKIIKALKEKGIYENTIFVFSSDNGPRIDPEQNLCGSANPLRGEKTETWDGGQKVPGIISWPAQIPSGKVCNQITGVMDLFPTFNSIIDAKIPENLKFDGVDISSLLQKPQTTKLAKRPFFFYSRSGNIEAVRLGKWKLHIAKSRGWNKKKNGEFPISLYNLDTNVSESINVANENPKIVEQLKTLIDKGIERL